MDGIAEQPINQYIKSELSLPELIFPVFSTEHGYVHALGEPEVNYPVKPVFILKYRLWGRGESVKNIYRFVGGELR